MPHTTVGVSCGADFGERQRPVGRDGQERSGDNEPHEPRNAIYKLLCCVFIFYPIISSFIIPNPSPNTKYEITPHIKKLKIRLYLVCLLVINSE